MGPHVILLNGPPKIGKGWLSNEISKLLCPVCSVRIMSLAAPIKEWAQSKYKFRSDEYMQWKDSEVERGMTGRDIMIRYGTEKRATDPEYFCKILAENPLFRNMDNGIVIIDDLGFFNENQFFHDNLYVRAATIVMSPTRYSVGMFWEGDSRQCLAPINGFRAIDSNKALETFKARIHDDFTAHLTRNQIFDRLGRSILR